MPVLAPGTAGREVLAATAAAVLVDLDPHAVDVGPGMTEAELQAEVERQLTAAGWLWHHCPRTTRCHGPAGWPDVVAFRPGRVLAAELKSDDGRASQAQLAAGRAIAASGAAWRRWDPGHLDGRIQHELKGD